MSTLRARSTPWQPRRDDSGKVVCRMCGGPIGKGRTRYCGAKCAHEWRLRSNPGYLSEMVHKRDKGRCAVCGLDTEAFLRLLRWLSRQNDGWPPELRAKEWAPDWAKDSYYWHRREAHLKRRLGVPDGRVLLWDAHHVVPVHQGGGECGLDNMVTLCWQCHKDAHARRAA